MSVDPNSEFERQKKERNKIIDATMPPPSNKSGKIQPKHTQPEGSVGKFFIKSDIGRKRRRRFGSSEVDQSVYDDFTAGLGFTPASISEVSSRDYQS